jgi:hypothetical protein
MVFDTSGFKRVVYKIFMKIVQILIKSTPYVIVKYLYTWKILKALYNVYDVTLIDNFQYQLLRAPLVEERLRWFTYDHKTNIRS